MTGWFVPWEVYTGTRVLLRYEIVEPSLPHPPPLLTCGTRGMDPHHVDVLKDHREI